VRPEQLGVAARNGRPGPNQLPAELKRAVEKPHHVRMEFAVGTAGAVHVDLPRTEYERQRENKDWVIHFPAALLRVL
jgi:hypothetical protein